MTTDEQSRAPEKLDILFENINFIGGLIALSALKSGLKVGFFLKNKIENCFRPELTNFYPGSISQANKALRNYQFSMKCSSLFAQLYYPQRVLSLNENSQTAPGFTIAVDKLLSRDRESSTLPIRTEKYSAYKNLSENFPYASLLYEYRLDRNRAIIELLKLNLEYGGLILTNENQITHKLKIKCHTKNSAHKSLTSPIQKVSYPNPVRFNHSDFSITIYKALSETSLHIERKSKNISKNEFSASIFSYLTKLGVGLNDSITEEVNRLCASISLNKPKNEWEIYDADLNNLRTDTLAISRKISTHLSSKIDLNTIFKNHSQNSITGENFRKIQTECDEKFDLAKQTGIDYNRFLHLFYRYRFSIDLMIEDAYEMMNAERNAEIIWTNVENRFLKNEMKELLK